ncbi:hypothetical protein RchiOBHm_Chr7g0233671 [Rosa chinensis]|uniref:Uncharacterized protein n=1 Tax=Rosa chinensis TaxID=74649 RepID=A0A2P6PG88_ROSCH|nr:hypothetical protein RchiOBHm_Chr7g0233671 [Rosa chinensis]
MRNYYQEMKITTSSKNRMIGLWILIHLKPSFFWICSIHGAGMDPSPSNSVERCRRKCLLEQAFFSEVKLERRMRLGGLCFSKD